MKTELPPYRSRSIAPRALLLFATLVLASCSSSTNKNGNGDAGVTPDGGGALPIGSACTSDQQCGQANSDCITSLYPLVGLTTDPTLTSIGVDFPQGYCSKTPNCQTDADCGPGGGCFWPLQHVSAQTIADLGAGLGGVDLTSFGQLGICMKPCTQNTDCRNGYECVTPLGDVISLVPGASLGTYCVGIAGCQACKANSTCNTSGATPTCACNAGYQGDPLVGCTLIDGCSANPCVYGTCTSTGTTTYTCACQTGWTGTNCDTAVDPCTPSPCQNGGSCLATGATTFTCSCPTGYTGTTCQTPVVGCASNPCLNGATCVPGTGSAYTCSCTAGWTGANCDMPSDPCAAANPCLNGGTCNNPSPGAYTCACANGFSGTTCATNINECAVNPCMNGGTCVDGIASYTCNCANGFSGTMCETNINDCASNPCLNGGSCVDGIASYTCTCLAGFSGTMCETNINDCAVNPCQNGGTCTDGVNSYTCACVGGYTGTTCQTPPDGCYAMPCANGSCAPGAGTSYTCACTTGWSGTNCDQAINACLPSNPCMNGGSCSMTGPGTYSCTCATGFTGAQCQTNIDDCAGNPCMNGGTCIDGIASFTCNCATGYSGATCATNINDCAPNPCMNGGTCMDLVAAYSCTCPAGFTGAQCQTVVMGCASNPCANGTCTNGAGGTYSCACSPGWSGVNCDMAVSCSGATAPANGTVSAATATYNNTVTYACNAGYTLTGSATQTCQANGTFSGSAPTCVATATYCPALTAPTNGAVAVAGGIAGGTTTSLNATGTYTCNAGFAVSGGATRTCQSGGAWSGAAPTCVASSCGAYTDVVYSIVAGFAIKGTTLGIGNQSFSNLANNSTTPMWGTNGGTGSTSPFNVPSTSTRGFARIRYTNDAAGNPLHATANLVEMYVPLEFHQTAGATVDADVDHSYHLINNTLSNCGGGDAACTGHTPGISRPCTAGAAGTFTANTLNWGSCTPNPTGANSWSFVNARAVTGAGCATGWNAWGNTRSTSGLVPASGKGDSYQTWNQQLKPFVFNGANPLTATFTMAEMQVPNGTNMSNTWMQVTSSTVIGTDCGTTIGTDLVCNIQ